jgi:predicted SAM-dependent methyltransferase
MVRGEMNRLWVRLNTSVNPLYLHRTRNFRKCRELSVNIGCGPFGRRGWVNLDVMKMPMGSLRFDCRRSLLFSDSSVKRIRCEHFLEHLDRHEEVPRLLKDCFRVLQQGGILRIVVPDAVSYIRAYCTGDKEAWLALGWNLDDLPPDLMTRMDIINHVFHQGGEHLYAYDFETLESCLMSAGFTNVLRSNFGRSQDPELRDDLPNHRPYSLYIEAVKYPIP